jgi:hypothetical protein
MDGKNSAQYSQLIDYVESSLFEIGDESNISKLREPTCYRLQAGREEFISAVVRSHPSVHQSTNLTLQIPYLNHESYGARKVLIDQVQNRAPTGVRVRIPEDVAKRVERIVAAAQDYGNLVHLPKTLDGSYYLGLEESDMDSRDNDQCVSKDWEK